MYSIQERLPLSDSHKRYPRKSSSHWKKTLLYAALCIFGILLMVFVTIFVIVPLVFMNSKSLQTKLIFQTWDNDPRNPEFTNSRKYGLEGVRNLYVSVNDQTILGVWHILPETYLDEVKENDNFDYEQALRNTNEKVVLYFHGTGGHRITPIQTYKVLRKHFHVIAFDYRGYADSSHIAPKEETVVEDSIALYKWLRKQTEATIFVWGHSLGTALSTRMVAQLRDSNIVPMGLFLEAAFTTIKEELSGSNNPIAKIFSWLPWYGITVLDPLYDNGFRFETTTNIKKVDCPIVIMHAEDDPIIPYQLSEKLCAETRKNRKNTQGNVTMHLFPAKLKYNHADISKSPDLPEIIELHYSLAYCC